MRLSGTLAATSGAREQSAGHDRLIRLARALAPLGTTPIDDAAQTLVRAVRQFLGTGAAALAARPCQPGAPMVFRDSSPDLLLSDEDSDRLLKAMCLTTDQGRLPGSSPVDLTSSAEYEWLVQRRGYHTAIAVPLVNGAGALFVVDRPDRSLSGVDVIGLGLAAAVADGLASRLLRRWETADRQETALGRLSAHAVMAAEVQDVAGNGIAVAMGWLDVLATDALEEVDRQRAGDAARRRLAQVQTAVAHFVEATTVSLVTAEAVESVDISAAWLAVHPYAAVIRGSGSPIVVTRGHHLRQFLRRASSLLVPELQLAGEHLRIEVTDAAQLDRETRLHLRAAEGILEQQLGRTYAVWRLARPWH